MSEAFDLLVVGRPSVDLMFSGLPEWPSIGRDIETTSFGLCAGTSFNTPASANRLGMRVAYVATIGNDPWSDMIKQEWEAEGLPDDFLRIESRPLPGLSVALNHDGDRGFVSYWGDDEEGDDGLHERAMDVAATVEARHLHLYADEMPDVEVVARQRGMTVSLDASDGTSTAERSLEDVVRNADVLFANAIEACALAGEPDAEHAAARLAELCPCVVVKRGALGAIGVADGTTRSIAADRVDAVDTTGAGDCLNAGFLAGWLAGLPLEDSLTLGVICGTRSVTDFGGYRACPTRSELVDLAAARGVTFPMVGGP